MDRWIASYQDKMSFEEFKAKVTTINMNKNDRRTKEDILGMVNKIIESPMERG